jgi:hypothetical protein
MENQLAILGHNPYPKGVHDNPNIITEIRMLTQSLASSINEKREITVKMRLERMGIQREMKEEKKTLGDIDYTFKIL